MVALVLVIALAATPVGVAQEVVPPGGVPPSVSVKVPLITLILPQEIPVPEVVTQLFKSKVLEPAVLPGILTILTPFPALFQVKGVPETTVSGVEFDSIW